MVIYTQKPPTWPVVRKQFDKWIKKHNIEIMLDEGVDHAEIATSRARLRRIRAVLPKFSGAVHPDDMVITSRITIDEIEVI